MINIDPYPLERNREITIELTYYASKLTVAG